MRAVSSEICFAWDVRPFSSLIFGAPLCVSWGYASRNLAIDDRYDISTFADFMSHIRSHNVRILVAHRAEGQGLPPSPAARVPSQTGKLEHRTIANLTHCKAQKVVDIRLALRRYTDSARMVTAA